VHTTPCCARHYKSSLPTDLSQDSPANTVDPPPYPNHVQKLPPVSQLSHPQAQAALLHTNAASQPPLHHAVAWDTHQQSYPGHTTDSVPTRGAAARHHGTSAAPWSMVEPVEIPNPSTVYGQPQDMGQDWAVVARGPPEPHELYVQHQAPVEHVDRTTAQIVAQSRPQTKKKAAKVPSSFVERQEKLKVSKRKGPLQERQREKTHTMRKTKRICVRCRFYKSGVRISFVPLD